MKVSHNSSRVQGSASHNDRSFDIQKADHINPEKLKDNRYWCIYDGMPFEEAEKQYYRDNYSPMMEKTNRSAKRTRTTEEFLQMTRYKPQELILQIGNVQETIKDPAVFDACLNDYLKYLDSWNREHGNHMHILNYAVHKDEATIHAHIRRVWDYIDQDGIKKIGQEKALEQAGLFPPDINASNGRRNNRMVTFEQMMRDKWIEICEDHGITVDKSPKKDRHKKINDYKRDKEIEKIDVLRNNIREISGLAERALGEIPAGHIFKDEEGREYVKLQDMEYEDLLLASYNMTSAKKSMEQKEEQVSILEKKSRQTETQLSDIKKEISKLETEIKELKAFIRESDKELLQDVLQKGMEAMQQPDDRETIYIGHQERAFNHEKYCSVYDAMSAMEEEYEGQQEIAEEEENRRV